VDLWRWWLGFAAAGSAVVSACCGDWFWMAVAGAVVLRLLASWVRSEMATTRRWMAKTELSLAEMVAVADRYAAQSAAARRRAARMAEHGL
jgi:hypothetical protein